MLHEILKFEIKYRLKRTETYLYFFLLFIAAFIAMAAAGGAFGGDIIIGDPSAGKVNANSPFQINWIITTLSWFGVLIVSSTMGTPILRDFQYNTHSLYYTMPISKPGYLLGRFTGAFIVTLGIFTGITAGALVGTYMPWIEADSMGASKLIWYFHPYLLIVIPNLIFTGAVFFTLATLTRSVLSIYVGAVVFIILYGIGRSFSSDIDSVIIANLIDPLGSVAIDLTQRYWTTWERNTLMLPLSNYVLANRILWIGIGLGILSFGYYRFRFSIEQFSHKPSRRSIKMEPRQEFAQTDILVFPKMVQNFSFKLSLSQCFRLTKIELREILKSTYFIAILIAGILFLFVMGTKIGEMYDTTVYPVTSAVVRLLNGTFSLFMLIIITFYAGELVWRERDFRFNQIYDALPIPNWVPFVSKLSALMLLQVLLLFVVMICGIIIQTISGYYKYEFDVYFAGLFGIELIEYLMICVLAMLIQVLVNNKYLGHFLMVVYYLLNIFHEELGLEHNLLVFNSDPGISYSAMNRYGHFLWPFAVFKIYWASFAVVLAIVANIFWPRGTENSLKNRLKTAKSKISRKTIGVMAGAIVFFCFTGGYIYYNTNVVNSYLTSVREQEKRAEYEEKYKRFQGIPQPRITDVKLKVAIFPKERDISLKGHFWIKNKNQKAVDSIHLTIPPEADIKQIAFNKGFVLALEDSKLGYFIYRLEVPLKPNDSIKLMMDLLYQTEGFVNDGSNENIVHNGTFINNSYLPKIGYDKYLELTNGGVRKDNQLEPKEGMAHVTDSVALLNNYLSSDADWIRFEAVVSTAEDQIAIAPGELKRQWKKKNRRYFHYEVDTLIPNFYAFLSARYAVKRDKWIRKNGQAVDIEIFYHPGHEYNLDRMIRSVQKSLEYYASNFSPYQHDLIRIVEFPGYESFAQSFPTTIPYSESVGFIADVEEVEDVDYPFYLTAHEVAHQWWSKQVLPGSVQGASFIVETLSQYSALMVMKEEYGEEEARKFLKYEMNSYLEGRAGEVKKELPLYKVEDQKYVYYRKGSAAMYALADYIGEENLNNALQAYLDQVAFQQPPYTNSVQLLNYIRRATPDSLQYFVTDLFEKITLYESKAVRANYRKLPEGKYSIEFVVMSKKFYADGEGGEMETKMEDYLEIGIFGTDPHDNSELGKPLYLKKNKLKNGINTIEIIVEEKPETAGVDPFHLLIDKNLEDNLITITSPGKK